MADVHRQPLWFAAPGEALRILPDGVIRADSRATFWAHRYLPAKPRVAAALLNWAAG